VKWLPTASLVIRLLTQPPNVPVRQYDRDFRAECQRLLELNTESFLLHYYPFFQREPPIVGAWPLFRVVMMGFGFV
jgi:hypothetical protein